MRSRPCAPPIENGRPAQCRRGGRSACLALAVAGGLFAASCGSPEDAAESPEGAPRYKLQPGRQYVYEVKVAADFPDFTDAFAGHSIFTVKAVDPGSGRMTISHRGTLSGWRKDRHRQNVQAPLVSLPGSPFPREVTIEPDGRIVRQQGESPLPYLLGDQALLVLDLLPAEDPATWESSRNVRYSSRNMLFPPAGPFVGVARLNGTARERIAYSSSKSADGRLVIQTRLEWRTDEENADAPRLEWAGTGTSTFDLQQGIPVKLERELTITVRQSEPVSIPVTVTARLLDSAETEKFLKERQQRLDEYRRARAAKEARQAEPIVETLPRLRSAEEATVREALNKLKHAAPNDVDRAAVLRALAPLLDAPNTSHRASAIEATGVWGTEDDVPRLVELSNHEDRRTRWAALQALGRIGGSQAAAAVADRIAEPFDRGSARRALRQMGGIAEDAVLKLLRHEDKRVRSAALEILADVGTARSLPAVRDLVDDPFAVGVQARQTVEAIERRERTSPK